MSYMDLPWERPPEYDDPPEDDPMDDTAELLRDIARQIEEEREVVGEMVALLREAIEKVPGWAGVNDDAHGWYVRAKEVLEKAE